MEREIAHVAVYVRKSREEETEDTLKRQQAVLTDLCVKNLWKYDLYKEVGSSQDLDRPQLQKMLEKVKSFHYDGIVVADLDRLSRNTGHFGTIKEIIINAGCLVITPTKNYDFTVQEDDLFSDIQSVLAKNEYQTIKKRLVRGTRQSAKDGNWLGKKTPIGYEYDRDTKRLKPTEDAEVIKRIFDEYVNGLSTKEIAIRFTNENVSTSIGMIWTPSGISRLLNNVAYKGDSLFGKTKRTSTKKAVKTKVEEQILIENTHEPIVSREQWDKVQEIKLKRNSKPIALKNGKHKFSGLIRCRLCGAVHSFQTSRGGKKRITSCQTRNYNDVKTKYALCENKGANVEDFEKYFFQSFEKYLGNLEKYVNQIKLSDKGNNDNLATKINQYEKQLKKNQQEIKRVQQGFVMEIFTENEAQGQIKGLKAQREVIEQELTNLKSKASESTTSHEEKVLGKLKEFYTGHDTMAESRANDLLRECIKGILYKKVGDDPDIELTIVWL